MKSLNFNHTVCRVCSRFCTDGELYCSPVCAKAEPCSTVGCCYKAFKKQKCQYCYTGTKRIRCIVCQRRICKYMYCSEKCRKAPRCCGTGQVWVDFEEKYVLKCLNCIYKNDETDDAVYGIPERVYVLIISDEHLLVHKRGPTIRNPGKISVVSGGVESGESSREAAIREMKEEADFNLTPYALARICSYAYALELPSCVRRRPFHPSKGFEYEIDDTFGYQWMPLANLNTSKFVKRLVTAYRRYKKYTKKKLARKLPIFIGFPNTRLHFDCPKIEPSFDHLPFHDCQTQAVPD